MSKFGGVPVNQTGGGKFGGVAVEADDVAEEEQPEGPFDVGQFLSDEVNPRLQALAQGSSFGTVDDAYSYLTNKIGELQYGDDPMGIGDNRTEEQKKDDFWKGFDATRAGAKEEREQFAAENPGEALMWELAGGILLPGAGGAKLGYKAGDSALRVGAKFGAAGAIEGGLYGAGIADGDNMTESILRNSMFGLGGGAVMGTAGTKIARAVKANAKARGVAKQAGEDAVYMDKVDDAFAVTRAKNPDMTNEQIMADMVRTGKVTEADLADVMARTGRKIMVRGQVHSELVADQIAKAAAVKHPHDITKAGAAVATTLDKVMGSISTRIKNKSVPIFAKLREHDMLQSKRTQDWMHQVEGFGRLSKGKYKELNKGVKKLLINDRWDEAQRLVDSVDDAAMSRGMREVRKLLDDMASGDASNHNSWASVGHDVQENANYFPRSVKDVDELSTALGKGEKNPLQKSLDAALAKKKANTAKRGGNPHGVSLTERERTNIANSVAKSGVVKGGKDIPGNLQGRTIEHVSDDLLDQYDDPVEAITKYLTRAAEDMEERRMFGRHASGTDSSIDVEETVGAFLQQHQMDGDITGSDVRELTELLGVRFGTGKQGPDKIAQHIKNIGLMTALGNPKSAMIQIADLGHSFAFNGVRNTAKAMWPGNRHFKVGDVGLDNIIQQEFNTNGKTAKALDEVLRVTGFKKLDRFGKETFINAAINKARKQTAGRVDDAFSNKWSEVFGDEYGQLVQDIQNGVDSDNVRLMLFHEIADIQPVSLSEMPQKYLELENGRLMYALKSFALKQMDIMRTKVAHEWAAGRKKEAAKNFVSYVAFTGGATTMTNEARNAIFSGGNDPIDLTPDNVAMETVWHMMAMTGLINKYSVERSRGDLAHVVGQGIMPPLGVYGAASKDLYDVVVGDGPDSVAEMSTVKAVPIIGPTIHGMFGGGFEAARKRARQ